MILIYFGALIPPYSFIWIGLFLLSSLGSIFLGAKILRIERQEMSSPKGLFPLALQVWGVQIACIFLSGIAMLLTATVLPVFSELVSEFGSYQQTLFQWLLYIFCWAIFAGILSSCSFGFFHNAISNSKKRMKLFICSLSVFCVIHISSVILYTVFISPS